MIDLCELDALAQTLSKGNSIRATRSELGSQGILIGGVGQSRLRIFRDLLSRFVCDGVNRTKVESVQPNEFVVANQYCGVVQ